MRWGILGAANIARRFLEGVRKGGAGEVQAVASRSRAKAEQFAAREFIPNVYGSYEELVEADDVDLVYIPLPNSLHARWTIMCLEAGKPVLCEKPFTVSAAQARRVAAVSRATGVPAVEAFMYRHHPQYLEVRSLLDSGAIGRLHTLRLQFSHRLEDRTIVQADLALGGGALLDLGCYCVSAARLLVQSDPIKVLGWERRSDIDDTFLGILEFPGGVAAKIEASFLTAPRVGIELLGEAGRINVRRPWHSREKAEQLHLETGEGTTVVGCAGDDPFRAQAADLVDAWTRKRRPRWSVEDGVANMTVIDALYRSAREGRIVDVRYEEV